MKHTFVISFFYYYYLNCFSEQTSPPFPVVLGCGQTSTGYMSTTKAVCILCQEDQEITYNGRAMVLSAFVQR